MGWAWGRARGPTGPLLRPAPRSQADSLQDRPSASQALVARRAKERTSLRSFSGGALPKMASLQQLHDWVFTAHSAYAPAGVLAKRAMNDSNTAASY